MGALARFLAVVFASELALACTGVTTGESPARAETPEQELARALAAVSEGRFREAEPLLLRLAATESLQTARASVALAEVELMEGRGDAALARAQPHCRVSASVALEACSLAAEVMRRRGDVDAAIALLEPAATALGARQLRLALADMLADRGRGSEARLIYRRLVDDFAQSRISNADGRELAIAGRAAQRLGTWRDANEFYSRAEIAGVADLAALTWRGDLYLEAHDPARARAVAEEALRLAPEHPDALLLSARVQMTTTQESDQGEQYVKQVLAIDPHRGDAHALLARLALRDRAFEDANAHIDRGLEREPRHLELLRLRAVARFLADDSPSFERATIDVLRENPNDARVYRMVAEFAEFEHRYDDTIPLLRRAVELDPEDAITRAQLGMQLVRSGSEGPGRKQLELAFRRDPFDLRVRNTLTLYEQKIDKEYSMLHHGQFAIRLPNRYREILQPIVSEWLDEAERVLRQRYGRVGTQKVVVELYEDLDSFGVRTSGVPSTFLLGQCFGRVIVARLPTDEPTNLGMTLWHELSHVHHLALSKGRVPRWFTEGLAEVETVGRRNEWSREQDLAVYEAWKGGRLAEVKRMNHAFSHAATLDDLAVAYVASAYLVEYIVQRYGYPQIAKMLLAWGEHKSTEEVVSRTLGVDIDDLDREYRAALQQRLRHFEHQYLPRQYSEPVEVARKHFSEHSDDPNARAALVHAEMRRGRLANAREILAGASFEHIDAPDLLWVSSLVDAADQRPTPADVALERMVHLGYDGYFVRMQLALVARMGNDLPRERAELEKAHEFHPRAAEPLYRLVAMAHDSGDTRGELVTLERLSRLEETDLQVHYRLVELYLELGRPKDAQLAAEGLLFVNPLDANACRLRARVAVANGQSRLAATESERARRLTKLAIPRDN